MTIYTRSLFILCFFTLLNNISSLHAAAAAMPTTDEILAKGTVLRSCTCHGQQVAAYLHDRKSLASIKPEDVIIDKTGRAFVLNGTLGFKQTSGFTKPEKINNLATREDAIDRKKDSFHFGIPH